MSRAARATVNFPPSRPVFSILSNVPSPLFRKTRFASPALPMTRSGKPSLSRSAHIAVTPQPQATTPDPSVTSANSEPVTFFLRELSPCRRRLHAAAPAAATRMTARARNRRTKVEYRARDRMGENEAGIDQEGAHGRERLLHRERPEGRGMVREARVGQRAGRRRDSGVVGSGAAHQGRDGPLRERGLRRTRARPLPRQDDGLAGRGRASPDGNGHGARGPG